METCVGGVFSVLQSLQITVEMQWHFLYNKDGMITKASETMGIFLTLAFLFFIGSLAGWLLELVYRNWKDPSHRFINPGFCTGPYVPLYGCGLCLLYLIASLESQQLIAHPVGNKVLLFVMMAVAMTLIEYIAGEFCLRVLQVRLWDYSDRWGNIRGIICPTFSFYWSILGALYYFLVHPHVLDALNWLSRNLAFSFFVGMFFGVFIIDVVHSAQIVVKLRKFAADHQVVVRYEGIKARIRENRQELAAKYHFFRPFRTEMPLHEFLETLREEVRHDVLEDIQEVVAWRKRSGPRR